MNREDFVHEVDARPTKVFDTVGAGDAFSAALTLGLLGGCEMKMVAEAACRIAEYVCSRPGATPDLPDTLVAKIPFVAGSDHSL
jgi:fructokinase